MKVWVNQDNDIIIRDRDTKDYIGIFWLGVIVGRRNNALPMSESPFILTPHRGDKLRYLGEGDVTVAWKYLRLPNENKEGGE